MPTYYPINEETARVAHMMHYMSDYKTGSCTAEYHAAVDRAAALVEEQKQLVSPFYHGKLDSLLDTYSRRLAQWYNDNSRNDAAYPSQFISGASGFNMRKHNKQMSRMDSLMHEYDDIKAILDKIRSVGTGPVDLTDPQAREILTANLAGLQKELEDCKAANAYYRKHGTIEGCPGIGPKTAEFLTRPNMFACGSYLDLNKCPFPAYHLSGIRSKMKRVQARLAELDKLEAAAKAPADSIEFDGGEIVQNAGLNRLQILFDVIPSPDLRQELKSYGFRWSPANKAWQRQLTQNAIYDAKKILHIED